MHTRSLHPLASLRCPGWLARLVLACVCLAVLAPTVSRWLQHVTGAAAWQIVCHSSPNQPGAVSLVRVDASGKPADPRGSSQPSGDCPLCVLHAHGWAPAPSHADHLPVDLPRDGLPLLFLASPRPLFAWAAPWATGPPSQM